MSTKYRKQNISKNAVFRMVALVDYIRRDSMGEVKSPILDFDWERDLEKVPPPRKGAVQPLMSGEDITEGLLRGTTNNLNWRIQKDPKDFLTIQGISKEIPVHALVWKETLDKYLWQYYCLKFAQSENETQDDWIKVYLPDKIIRKLEKYKREQTSKKTKHIPVNTDFLQIANKEKPDNYYKTPAIGHACYLNLLFRYLDTRKTASSLLLAPQYDGSKYRSEKGYPLPQFELIDYCQHEYMTDISLTIEIASIFIEVREKLYAYEMWDEAFKVFAQLALPKIVKSHHIFTRIAVARHFFQQILVERTKEAYEWKAEKAKDWKADEHWNLLMDRAISFTDILDDPSEPYVLPDEQIEGAVSHIEKLLKQIEDPVKLSDLDKRTQNGLALFCNRKHENVDYFLGNLEKIGIDRIPVDSADPNNKLLIFSKVRQAVKNASLSKDNSESIIINESEIMGRNPSKHLKIHILQNDSGDKV